MIMNVLMWLVSGAVIGYIATAVMRMHAEHATTSNVIVGMIGAFVGGALSLAMSDESGFSMMSLIVAVICAVILLALVRMFSHRGNRPLMHH